jgi:hypothetical protein
MCHWPRCVGCRQRRTRDICVFVACARPGFRFSKRMVAAQRQSSMLKRPEECMRNSGRTSGEGSPRIPDYRVVTQIKPRPLLFGGAGGGHSIMRPAPAGPFSAKSSGSRTSTGAAITLHYHNRGLPPLVVLLTTYQYILFLCLAWTVVSFVDGAAGRRN